MKITAENTVVLALAFLTAAFTSCAQKSVKGSSWTAEIDGQKTAISFTDDTNAVINAWDVNDEEDPSIDTTFVTYTYAKGKIALAEGEDHVIFDVKGDKMTSEIAADGTDTIQFTKLASNGYTGTVWTTKTPDGYAAFAFLDKIVLAIHSADSNDTFCAPYSVKGDEVTFGDQKDESRNMKLVKKDGKLTNTYAGISLEQVK